MPDQFRAVAGQQYIRQGDTTPVSFTQEQLNDPAMGWLSSQFSQYTAPTTTPPPTGGTPPPSGTTPPTTPGTTPPGNVPDFMSWLNQGYDDPQQIATASGKTLEEVNSFLGSNYQAQNLFNQNKLMNQLDAGYKEYAAKIAALNNGVFTLNPEEQAQINQITALFADMREKQITANKNFQGAITTSNIRSGMQEFMNETASGIYKQAVDDGVKKVKDLELEALSKVSELRQLFKDKRYKQIAESYNQLNDYLNQKRQAIGDIYKATNDYYNEIDKNSKLAEEAEQKKLQNEKLRQEIGGNTIEALSPMLKDADEDTLKEIADYYKLDLNMVKGSIEGSKQKQDKDYLGKGYKTISPKDVSKMKSSGRYDIIEESGRAYAKPKKLTSRTYKGVTTWFDEQGNVMKPESSSSGSSPKKVTPVTSPSNPVPPKSGKYLSTTKEKKSYDSASNQVEPMLQSQIGVDGKVSPTLYNHLKGEWEAQNLDPADFEKRFKKYKNKDNPYYR